LLFLERFEFWQKLLLMFLELDLDLSRKFRFVVGLVSVRGLLFGITKRSLARVNRMEGLNVQSSHIASVRSVSMAAATLINIVTTFRRAGNRSLLCLGDSQKIWCGWESAAAPVMLVREIADENDDDGAEAGLCVEYRAELLGDFTGFEE
jgi:hypothetical protein